MNTTILALDVTSLNLQCTLMAGRTDDTMPFIWVPSVKFDTVPVGKTSFFSDKSSIMITKGSLGK